MMPKEGAMNSTNDHRTTHSKGNDDRPGDTGAVGDASEAGDFLDETVAFWQKRSKRQLTREDGREIIENLTGFFRVLQEWDRAERAARKKS
jgi:hypothetical protein